LFEAIDEFFDEGQTRGFGNTQVSRAVSSSVLSR
jgi:hypothetical protein